ncbi:MAG TPA: penicillin-insensitive murein endopeptidase, partial [Xanthobacteraceae bacterium]|nr:penicillin-insensitive murein endopeptidase [Xanthobacteraceae bacterium]
MRARRPPISALRLAGLSAALFVVAALVAPKPVRAQSLAPGGAAAIPARELFGAASGPAPLAARAVGFYSKGCLAGGAALPVT